MVSILQSLKGWLKNPLHDQRIRNRTTDERIPGDQILILANNATSAFAGHVGKNLRCPSGG
jgi:hypothetical protein